MGASTFRSIAPDVRGDVSWRPAVDLESDEAVWEALGICLAAPGRLLVIERLPILADEVMAAALIDRLLHHCHIVNIRGNSYRMRKHSDLWNTLHPDEAEHLPTQEAPTP